MKYFLDTRIPAARTDSVRALWVPRSDPACLTCLRFLGRSGKRPSWPKIKPVSSQAKIKSIYKGEEANKVPILEALPCRKCNKWTGEVVLSTLAAWYCQQRSKQFAADVPNISSSQTYLTGPVGGKDVATKVYTRSHRRMHAPVHRTAGRLPPCTLRSSSFSIHSTQF